jgi:hypothetical protein
MWSNPFRGLAVLSFALACWALFASSAQAQTQDIAEGLEFVGIRDVVRIARETRRQIDLRRFPTQHSKTDYLPFTTYSPVKESKYQSS